MKKTYPIVPLFKQFIKDSETGKRLKKNGEKITQGSVDNYKYTLNNLEYFITATALSSASVMPPNLTNASVSQKKTTGKNSIKSLPNICTKTAATTIM